MPALPRSFRIFLLIQNLAKVVLVTVVNLGFLVATGAFLTRQSGGSVLIGFRQEVGILSARGRLVV